jgi:hypothetical protein
MMDTNTTRRVYETATALTLLALGERMDDPEGWLHDEAGVPQAVYVAAEQATLDPEALKVAAAHLLEWLKERHWQAQVDEVEP